MAAFQTSNDRRVFIWNLSILGFGLICQLDSVLNWAHLFDQCRPMRAEAEPAPALGLRTHQ